MNIVRSTHLKISDREKGGIERKGNLINYFIVPSDVWFNQEYTTNILLKSIQIPPKNYTLVKSKTIGAINSPIGMNIGEKKKLGAGCV